MNFRQRCSFRSNLQNSSAKWITHTQTSVSAFSANGSDTAAAEDVFMSLPFTLYISRGSSHVLRQLRCSWRRQASDPVMALILPSRCRECNYSSHNYCSSRCTAGRWVQILSSAALGKRKKKISRALLKWRNPLRGPFKLSNWKIMHWNPLEVTWRFHFVIDSSVCVVSAALFTVSIKKLFVHLTFHQSEYHSGFLQQTHLNEEIHFDDKSKILLSLSFEGFGAILGFYGLALRWKILWRNEGFLLYY